jgi:SseB protein C-terminal domain
LIAALGRELGAVKGMRGAWLTLAHRAGEAEQSWMLGVDHDGDWNDVRAAIGRAVAGGVLQGRMLDATPLVGSSLASTLRTGIPITSAKRGFFSKLFG